MQLIFAAANKLMLRSKGSQPSCHRWFKVADQLTSDYAGYIGGTCIDEPKNKDELLDLPPEPGD